MNKVFLYLYFLRFFNLTDPSWLELSHFVSFLNTQLTACERSVYCDANWVTDVSTGVTGFKSFVVKFMINMSVVSVCTYAMWCG